ncbi:MAG TPA: tail fiber domain-containing protein, partial [Casimicrobiaceae bacterium]|nr:tail fiber domain-containing protein [Casimicrobiaceae bacterium]
LQVFGMPTTNASGDIEILPQGATFGSTATMVYVASINFNTVSTAAKIDTADKQISVQVRGGGANVAIDVVGYFAAPTGNGGKFFMQGGNAFGTTAQIGTTDDQPLDLLLANVPIMRFEPTTNTYITPNIVGGDPTNSAASAFPGQTIAGGGTSLESVSCFASTRGGAVSCSNNTSNYFATVSGGDANLASGNSSTVAGGSLNAASGDSATVSGGIGNVASGDWATVPGGLSNVASGTASFAAGSGANANQNGCVLFVYWQIGGGADCFGTSYQFRVMGTHGLSIDYGTRLAGGNGTRWAVIGDTVSGKTFATWTNAYLSDGGTWVNASDRELKTDFHDIDRLEILAKVDAMPVTEWRYKVQRDEIHVGPVAQDFYAAFGLGADNKHIATVDEAGIALAAIQGLHRVVQEKEAQIQAQQHAIEDLRGEVNALKRAVAQLTHWNGAMSVEGSP